MGALSGQLRSEVQLTESGSMTQSSSSVAGVQRNLKHTTYLRQSDVVTMGHMTPVSFLISSADLYRADYNVMEEVLRFVIPFFLGRDEEEEEEEEEGENENMINDDDPLDQESEKVVFHSDKEANRDHVSVTSNPISDVDLAQTIDHGALDVLSMLGFERLNVHQHTKALHSDQVAHDDALAYEENTDCGLTEIHSAATPSLKVASLASNSKSREGQRVPDNHPDDGNNDHLDKGNNSVHNPRRATDTVRLASVPSTLGSFHSARIHQCSGGQRRVLAVAAALMTNPFVLLLDEVRFVEPNDGVLNEDPTMQFVLTTRFGFECGWDFFSLSLPVYL